MNRLRIAVVISLLTAGFTGPLRAQSTDEELRQRVRDLERQAERLEQDRRITSEPPRGSSEGAATTAIVRQPLLREGSYLTDLIGALKIDEATGAWVFIPETPATDGSRLRLFVIPSTALEQMQRTVESTELDVLFRLTARVFVYEQRNFILPLAPTRLERYQEAAPPAPTPGPGSGDTNGGQPATPPAGEQTAEEIMRSLRENVPLPRALESLPGASGGGGGAGTGSTGSAGSAGGSEREARLLEEETILVSRRGRLTRSSSGVLHFVFDADAAGLNDPPMSLLPCLLLERLHRDFRTLGTTHSDASILISGRVYTFRGKNYLLPTVYRIERVRGNIRS